MYMWMTKQMKKNKKGFTLIELIVVIAILGILAAILIPRLGGFTEKAQASACAADARTILTAYSTLVAEDSTLTTLPNGTDTDLTDLTGTLKGTISAQTVTGGKISFTYTLGDWQVVCTDGALAQPVAAP